MEITDAYRHARRNTSVLCGIGLAWSAAQFELKELDFGSVGIVDLSHASVPLILACGIVYTLIRCVIEYAMQSDDVRRWRLAQIDFKITVFLVRATLLVLAASGLYRSLKTIVYIVVASFLLLVIAVFLIFVGMLVLTPLMILIRSRQGRRSVAARVFEALSWSELIIAVLLAVALAVSGVASICYEPLRSMWTVAPSPIAVAIFVVTAIVMVISIYVQRIWYKKLFAFQDTCIMTKRPDGTIGVSFVDKQKDVVH